MRHKLSLLAFLLLQLWGLCTVHAALIKGRLLTASHGRYEEGFIHPTTKIQLNGGRFRTTVMADGRFAFSDVPSGNYVLEVKSPQFTFSKIHLHVKPSDEISASPYSIGDDWASTPSSLPYPLILRPRPSVTQYMSPQSRKVVGWFSNPLVLMSSFCLFMLLVLPRLAANLDPEAMQALRHLPDYPLLSDRQDLQQHVGYGGQSQTLAPVGTSSSPPISSSSSVAAPAASRHPSKHGQYNVQQPFQPQRHTRPQPSYAKMATSAMMDALPTGSNSVQHQSQPFMASLTSTSQSSMTSFKKQQ